jgi:hypothetical protein
VYEYLKIEMLKSQLPFIIYIWTNETILFNAL